MKIVSTKKQGCVLNNYEFNCRIRIGTHNESFEEIKSELSQIYNQFYDDKKLRIMIEENVELFFGKNYLCHAGLLDYEERRGSLLLVFTIFIETIMNYDEVSSAVGYFMKDVVNFIKCNTEGRYEVHYGYYSPLKVRQRESFFEPNKYNFWKAILFPIFLLIALGLSLYSTIISNQQKKNTKEIFQEIIEQNRNQDKLNYIYYKNLINEEITHKQQVMDSLYLCFNNVKLADRLVNIEKLIGNLSISLTRKKDKDRTITEKKKYIQSEKKGISSKGCDINIYNVNIEKKDSLYVNYK